MILNKEKGQATIEMVLLMALVVSTWIGVNKTLAKTGAFKAIFGEPWTRLKNTIEFGVPTDKNNSGSAHPAHWTRHSTRLKK